MNIEDNLKSIITKAIIDKKYMERLESNPIKVLDEEGIKLKKGISVKLYYDKDDMPKEANLNELPILIPSKEDQDNIKNELIKIYKELEEEDISNDELENVAGGQGQAHNP